MSPRRIGEGERRGFLMSSRPRTGYVGGLLDPLVGLMLAPHFCSHRLRLRACQRHAVGGSERGVSAGQHRHPHGGRDGPGYLLSGLCRIPHRFQVHEPGERGPSDWGFRSPSPSLTVMAPPHRFRAWQDGLALAVNLGRGVSQQDIIDGDASLGLLPAWRPSSHPANHDNRKLPRSAHGVRRQPLQ